MSGSPSSATVVACSTPRRCAGRYSPTLKPARPDVYHPRQMSQPAATRPYLVFVRAGAESLHRRLLAENPDRNWDCCVSWYVPPIAEQLAEYYSAGGFNQLDGFLEFWKQRAT